jgi:hypothetical protein
VKNLCDLEHTLSDGLGKRRAAHVSVFPHHTPHFLLAVSSLLPRTASMNTVSDAGPSHAPRSDRARAFAGIPSRELAKLLAAQEKETRAAERALAGVHAQIAAEAERARAADTRAEALARKLRSVLDARRAAERDGARAGEELRLFRVQLDGARREIEHAQAVLDGVEQARVRAEADAAAARDAARKIGEERLVARAREEGRKLGLAEGLRRGKMAGFAEGRDSVANTHDTQRAEEEAAAAEAKRKEEEALQQRQEELARQREEEDRRRAEDARRQQEEDERRREEDRIREEEEEEHRRREAEEDARRRRREEEEEDRRREEEDRLREEEEEEDRRRQEEEDRHNRDVHPVIVHNAAPGFHHPRYDVPPDGFVPLAQDGAPIVLPPPHEFERPISDYDYGSRPVSVEPLPVPPPADARRASGGDWAGYAPRRRRASSPASDSTTLSQIDLISVAPDATPRGRVGGSGGGRRSGRSAGLGVVPPLSDSRLGRP